MVCYIWSTTASLVHNNSKRNKKTIELYFDWLTDGRTAKHESCWCECERGLFFSPLCETASVYLIEMSEVRFYSLAYLQHQKKTVINQISPYFSSLLRRSFLFIHSLAIHFCLNVNIVSCFRYFNSSVLALHDDCFVNDIIEILCSLCLFWFQSLFSVVLTMFAMQHGKINDEIWINEHDNNFFRAISSFQYQYDQISLSIYRGMMKKNFKAKNLQFTRVDWQMTTNPMNLCGLEIQPKIPFDWVESIKLT